MCRPRRRSIPILLLALIGSAGCSTTVGSKFKGSSTPSRSIAVVGDRPLPPKVGEPGAEVVADTTEPEPKRNPRARISGRVLDTQGRPVADATVRLADGGSKGGRDVSAITDRSGAFTLGGLRPGSTYWLVAETEDGRESGRARATTADTGVQISLGDDGGADASAADRPRLGRPTRARPISDREEVEDDGGSPRINAEDLPPAAGADPEPSPTGRRSPTASGEPSVGWRRPGDAPRVSRKSDPEPTGDQDDGGNPLPPAIEPRQASDDEPAPSRAPVARRKVSARMTPPAGNPGELAIAPTETPTPAAAEPPPMPALLFAQMAAEVQSPPVLAQQVPEPPPADPPPPSGPAPTPVAANPAPEPVFASPEPTRDYNPFSLARPDRVALAAADVPVIVPTSAPVAPPANEPSADDPPADEVPAPVARKKWGDVAVAEPKPKSNPKPATDPTTRLTSLISRRLHPSPVVKASSVALCEFDPKQRRVVDLRLPDLEGKPVRLRDLDSDFVLLDFWGTWCKPCLESIPHLVALQKQYGPGKLQVVGVACEKSQGDRARAEVDAFARKLGINYAVVVSAMDGNCPVQQALKVRYYPTLILLDRKGQILWTAEGATPANLYRLDRALAAAASGKAETARR